MVDRIKKVLDQELLADASMSDTTNYNVRVTNGSTHEGKTPFLIGVAGGTASGKVISNYLNYKDTHSLL